MLSFFKRIFFESLCNFRITFTVCLTAHCQIHTNFTAFSVKMSNQTFVNIFFNFVCCTYADYVFSCIACFFCLLIKFVSRSFTNWAEFRCLVSYMNITTYTTYKFFHCKNLHIHSLNIVMA